MPFPAESPGPAAGREILTVGELTRRIKRALENAVRYVWVAGEISNLRPASPAGHLYFTLKDGESQIPCAMWKGFAARLRFEPADGMEVLAYGRVEVYLPQGRYQLIVEEMQPRGVGALQLRFEQLKEKLAREGLFDPARKRPLPLLPLRVALVTSPVGAALQDMLRTLRTRCPILHILIFPVRVQGEGAAEEIASAIAQINLARPDVDVLIVGRGGGSIEDLWAFNEEVVARAIHASRIPVVSAVGHETDVTLADFAADVRALTPTDGAVRAVPRLDEILLRMEDLGTKLRRTLRTRADLARSALDLLRDGRALGRVEDLPLALGQRLDELRERLQGGLRQASARIRCRLESLRGALDGLLPALPALARGRLEPLAGLLASHVRRASERAAARLRAAAAGLEALSPLRVLSRGYSITRLERSGEILREARRAAPGDLLRTLLGSGTLLSRVEEEPPKTQHA